MKSTILKNPLLQIHLAVFLWGFTAILGKLISIDTLGLVFLRMTIASLGFYAWKQTRIEVRKLKFNQILRLAGIGWTICIHWLCFYQSIKEYHSSSIALICLGLGPMFVVWLEFLFGIQRRLSLLPILISLVAFIGIYFIANGSRVSSFHLDRWGAYEWSIGYGIAASFLAAFFTIMNRSMAQVIHPSTLSFVEIATGAICLWFYHIIFLDFDFLWHISLSDSFYILILSIICTNIPFLLSIYSLQKLDAFIVTLTVNLEPIYGLIFAACLFHEYREFQFKFFVGAGLILISVFLPLIFQKCKKEKK